MKYLLSMLCIVVGGCGPVIFPAVQRLQPEDQAMVDQVWNNMLSPPDRLDRELLLDVMLAYDLHYLGIDRLKADFQKDFKGGTVEMLIDFNRRRSPDRDRFTVIIRNRHGKVIRRETYSNEEVLSHAQQISRMLGVTTSTTEPSNETSMPLPTVRPTSEPSERTMTKDQLAHEKWLKARMQQIEAATQPAKPPANHK